VTLIYAAFSLLKELIDGEKKTQISKCIKTSGSCKKVSFGYIEKVWKPFFVSAEVQRTAFCCGDKQIKNIQKIPSHVCGGQSFSWPGNSHKQTFKLFLYFFI